MEGRSLRDRLRSVEAELREAMEVRSPVDVESDIALQLVADRLARGDMTLVEWLEIGRRHRGALARHSDLAHAILVVDEPLNRFVLAQSARDFWTGLRALGDAPWDFAGEE